MNRAEAGYSDKTGTPDNRCGNCISFIDPNKCRLVSGPVMPNGLCKFWQPLDQSSQGQPSPGSQPDLMSLMFGPQGPGASAGPQGMSQ